MQLNIVLRLSQQFHGKLHDTVGKDVQIRAVAVDDVIVPSLAENNRLHAAVKHRPHHVFDEIPEIGATVLFHPVKRLDGDRRVRLLACSHLLKQRKRFRLGQRLFRPIAGDDRSPPCIRRSLRLKAAALIKVKIVVLHFFSPNLRLSMRAMQSPSRRAISLRFILRSSCFFLFPVLLIFPAWLIPLRARRILR